MTHAPVRVTQTWVLAPVGDRGHPLTTSCVQMLYRVVLFGFLHVYCGFLVSMRELLLCDY